MRFLNYNLVTQDATTLTASSINANFPVTNLKNPLRSKKVRTATGTTTLTIVIDTQTTEVVNSVVLLWPKEDGIKLTDAATVTVQANATNLWTSPAVSQVLTINNDYSVASHFFSTSQNYRYWRIVIADATNPDSYVELGVAWIGNALSVQNAENGFTWVDMDRSQTVSNDFGHRYTDEYPISSTLEIEFKYLDIADVQVLQNAYRTNGMRKPVLVVLDPEDTVFDKDQFLIYGTMSKPFSLAHVNYNIMNVENLTIEELS